MEKLKKLLTGETGRYLFWGVLTSCVSYGSFWLALRALGDRYALWGNLFSFLCAVTFAYVTNKLWVFDSKSWALRTVLPEAVAFVGGRLATFGAEEAGLALAIALGAAGNWLLFWKVALSFLAVALNYGVAKLLVFRKK